MTDLPTLSYTSTSEIPTLSYPWPEAWERYPFRAEPLRIDHYREYLPSGSNPNRYILTCNGSLVSEANRGVDRSARDFFFFHFFFSLFFNCFLYFFPWLRSLILSYTVRFILEPFSLPGLNKLFSWKNIPVERVVLPSKIEHTLKLELGC